MSTDLLIMAKHNADNWWRYAVSIFRELPYTANGKEFKGLNIGEIPDIRFNPRFTATAGRTFIELDYIELSPFLMERNLNTFLSEIIPHELAHVIAWRIFKDNGHGRGWKDTMRLIGLEPVRCHNMFTKNDLKRAGII